MKSLLEHQTRTEVERRLERLAPAARPRWGRMTAVAMVAHLADSLRLALGDLPAAPKSSVLRLPPLKQIAVYWLPIPRGVSGAPELTARLEGAAGLEWTAERAAVSSLLDRFGRKAPGERWPVHPIFGPLSGQAWGVLSWRHIEHHLRQFAV